MRDERPRPAWISHRGFNAKHTENTAAAFAAARTLGFEHMETDLRTSADGHIVLAHDAHLRRLTDAPHGKTIEQSTRAELEAITLPCGGRLMFFDELLNRFSDVHWILDIKPESAPATLEKLLSLWQQPEYASFFDERVRFLLWRNSHQQQLLQGRPHARCMAPLNACRRAVIASLIKLPTLGNIKPGTTYAIPPALLGKKLLTRRFARAYQSRGAKVLGYLPENKEQTRWALAAGVEEILVDGEPGI